MQKTSPVHPSYTVFQIVHRYQSENYYPSLSPDLKTTKTSSSKLDNIHSNSPA